LSIANHLIKQNPDRLREDLAPLPEKEDDGEVEIVQWNTRRNETIGIAKKIQKLISTGKIPDDETILVLVPRNDFAHFLMKELQNLGVEDAKIHAKPKWGNEFRESFTIITLLQNPEDLVALRCWLGLGDSSWRKKEYARLRMACEEHGKKPGEILDDLTVCQSLKIMKLRSRWEELQAILSTLVDLDEEELLDTLLPLTGPTKEFGEIIRKLRDEDIKDKTINELFIQSMLAKADEDIDTRINIMTSHRAKGLTCHTVIICGVVNGILPKNPYPTNLEEEKELQESRRLLFVAITRAKHRVVLSSFRKVTKGENEQLKLGLQGDSYYLNTRASRFLSELGPDTPETIQGDDEV